MEASTTQDYEDSPRMRPILASVALSTAVAAVAAATGDSGGGATGGLISTGNASISQRSQTPPKRKPPPIKLISSSANCQATSASRTLELPTLNASSSTSNSNAPRNALTGL
ncbi:hypothetical protein ON010_g17577 [Phytophthora cinnamomi]|nr:hypothetical protein ON010_g17577 [Phytophthora cinnamomi]